MFKKLKRVFEPKPTEKQIEASEVLDQLGLDEERTSISRDEEFADLGIVYEIPDSANSLNNVEILQEFRPLRNKLEARLQAKKSFEDVSIGMDIVQAETGNYTAYFFINPLNPHFYINVYLSYFDVDIETYNWIIVKSDEYFDVPYGTTDVPRKAGAKFLEQYISVDNTEYYNKLQEKENLPIQELV